MAEIDKLLDNIVLRGVDRVVLVGGEPMVAFKSGQEGRGATFSKAQLFSMLREILPSEQRMKLASDGSFKVPLSTKKADFELAISHKKGVLSAQILPLFVFPTSIPTEVIPDEFTPLETAGFPARLSGIHSVALSPDGTLVACAYADNRVSIYDCETGKEVWDPISETSDSEEGIGGLIASMQERGAYSVCFSSNGQSLAIGDVSGWKLYDMRSGMILQQNSLQGTQSAVGKEAVVNLAYSSRQDRIITASFAHSGLNERGELASALAGTAFDIGTSLVSINAGGVTKRTDGSLALWSLENSKLLARFDIWKGDPFLAAPGGVTSVAASSQRGVIVAGTTRNSAKIFHFDEHVKQAGILSSGMPVYPPMRTIKLTEPVQSVAFSPNGEHILVGTNEDMSLWDLSGHNIWINRQRGFHSFFFPNGELIGASTSRETISFVDAVTGKVTRSAMHFDSKVTDISLTPSGRRLAVGRADGAFHVYDLW